MQARSATVPEQQVARLVVLFALALLFLIFAPYADVRWWAAPLAFAKPKRLRFGGAGLALTRSTLACWR